MGNANGLTFARIQLQNLRGFLMKTTKTKKTAKGNKEYARQYYLAHREHILKRANARYKPKGNGTCNGCGADIKELIKFNNGHFRYCDKCMSVTTKTSRQARWYRKNRFRLQKLRRKGDNQWKY